MNVSSEGGKGGSQDFDINLAPIIDCFTVLITFMLVSASFLSIGILAAGAEAPGQASADAKPPAVHLELSLLEHSEIEVKLTGKDQFTHKIPAKNGEWDLATVTTELQSVKNKWPEVQNLTLVAQNDIEYIHVIRTMESIRKTIPGVLLGGF